MVRTRRKQQDIAATTLRSSSRKRTREVVDEAKEGTQPKRRGGWPDASTRLDNPQLGYDFPSDDDTPTKPIGQGTPKGKGRLPAPTALNGNDEVSTPRGRKSKRINPVTPSGTKSRDSANGETPRRQRNDRSARKKSARALIEKVVGGVSSDEEVDEDIAREIYESSEDDDIIGEDNMEAHPIEGDPEELPDNAATPSRKSHGRTKAKTGIRKRSPTPPRHLPPHELYFAQNRPGAAKTSNNTLASLTLLTHEEYFSLLREYKDSHDDDIEFLDSIHVQSFPQWSFELSQGFSVCLYGYGSKRALLHKFAKHVANTTSHHGNHRIIVINGYVRANMSSLRDILSVVAEAIEPKHKLAAGGPSVMMENLKSLLSAHDIIITVILNSIDAVPLRRPGFQPVLAQLAAHPQIQFICSANTPDFTLLWDSSLRSSFGFIFHDCTTFVPFTTELEIIHDVHELLGRRARLVGGKEGVTYVLRSLTDNARNLYRLLVGEVLIAMDDEADCSGDENPGVEYKMIYNKAVEEFICSSEMAFRTLLKEFHDHQMITSRKDVLGTELLSVPFQKEELEGILEDIV
ncbi:putative origin recognition complex subunit 2 [Xylaria flabelliformis]|nr:putative origin recognition complex subunit 2 [Xylaria flabelliformis]